MQTIAVIPTFSATTIDEGSMSGFAVHCTRDALGALSVDQGMFCPAESLSLSSDEEKGQRHGSMELYFLRLSTSILIRF
jgi:hypothetical protein